MKFTISQKSFQAALNIVQRGLSGKNLMEVLKGIHIEAVDNTLLITTNNLELGILTRVPANVEEDGRILVEGKILFDIIRKLPNELIKFSVGNDNLVHISTSRSKFNIVAMINDRFPLLDEYDESDYKMVTSSLFSDMIRKTHFAASTDEARGVLTGELLEIDENSVTMVAIDGFRLAVKKIKSSLNLEPGKAVIPRNTLMEILRLSESSEKIGILFEERSVSFKIGDTVLNSNLLEGDFINYRQIVPKEFVTRVKINVTEFNEALERASVISNNKLVVLNISGDSMNLSSKNSEIGNLEENISVEFEGKDLEIAFNSRYFTEALRYFDDEYIYLNFNSNVSPCVAESESDPDFIYLLLPVRI